MTINSKWSTHAMTEPEKGRNPDYATTQVDLEDITLSEISYSQKGKYRMMAPRVVKFTDMECWLPEVEGEQEWRRYCLISTEFQRRKMKRVLLTVVQQCGRYETRLNRPVTNG